MLKTRRLLAAAGIVAVLFAAGCGSQPTTVTPGSSFGTEPTAAKVELGGVPFKLVIEKGSIGDLAAANGSWAGYADLSAVLINPDANADGTHNWYAYKISPVHHNKGAAPYTVQSAAILVGYDAKGYVFDVTTACAVVASTNTSPMDSWGNLTSDDPQIVKLTPVGTDTCSKPVEEPPQQ